MKRRDMAGILALGALMSLLAGCGADPAAAVQQTAAPAVTAQESAPAVTEPEPVEAAPETTEAPKEDEGVGSAETPDTTVSENATGTGDQETPQTETPATDPAAIVSPADPVNVETPPTPPIDDQTTIGDDSGNGDNDDQGCIGDEGLVW